jgi:hypothetical protein
MKNHWIETYECKSLRIWHIYDGEQWWYSAFTKEEALEMHSIEMFGDEELEITEVSPETIIPVRNEDTGKTELKTAKEWADDGKGMVASTIF